VQNNQLDQAGIVVFDLTLPTRALISQKIMSPPG
jgi:hypothetical protein